MNDFKKNVLQIDSCEMVSLHIKEIMPKILKLLMDELFLSYKLFAIEFLGSTTNDLLVTFIYHKKLDDEWI